MKFRIVKTGWLSYNADVAISDREWHTLDTFLTKWGAKRECIHFAEFCRGKFHLPKENIVEEFEL